MSASFGQTIRQLREEAGITLRKFAGMVDKTPTYISKIEREELAPPAEETIRRMAHVLYQDADDLITLAGKIPSDLPQIIKKQPHQMALMLRTASELSPKQLEEVTRKMAALSARKRKQNAG